MPAIEILSAAVRAAPLSLRERAGVRGSRGNFAAAESAPGPPHPNPLPEGEGSREATIGAIHALNHMVPDSVKYAYSRNPSEADTAEIASVWSRWWDQVQDAERQRAARKEPREYPPLSDQRQRALEARFAAMLDAPSRAEMYRRMEFFHAARFEPFQQADMRFFLQRLLHARTLQERVVASAVLAGYVGRPLAMDVADDASPAEVAHVADNWLVHFRYRRDRYQPGFWRKTWYVVADTQYAHMRGPPGHVPVRPLGRARPASRWPEDLGRGAGLRPDHAPCRGADLPGGRAAGDPLRGAPRAVGRPRDLARRCSCSTPSRRSWPACCSWCSSATATTCEWFPMTGLHSEGAEQLGWPAYAAGLPLAHRAAGGLPVAVQPGRHGHVRPHQHARRARPGLHPHGPGQGPARAQGDPQARLPQRADPHRHALRQLPARHARRQRADRVPLRHPGDGLR